MLAKRPLILLVDDNPRNCMLLGNMLAKENYEIGIAEDGLQALNFMKYETPDLILLDIMMPKLNGFDVCKKLKQDNNTKHIPVIFLTAKSDTLDEARAFKLGAVDYITKPFVSETVRARVRAHTQLKSYRDHLEELIDQRTSELKATMLDLENAKKLAEAANEAKNELLAKLKESQETMLTVLDRIDATIYTADMDSHEIIYMNQYMKDTFGSDGTGQPCHEFLRREAVPCTNCSNDKLLNADGQPEGYCVWEGRNPVTGKWYIYYARAIKWIDGRIVRMQIGTDITYRVEYEEKRQKMMDHIRQAQKMESIGQLAGGIAHDFNNLLFPIVVMSELLMEDLPSGSPEQKNVQQILKAGKRASELVKQILSFGRQSQYKLVPVEIQRVLKEVLKLCRSSIPADISIDCNIQSDCGLVMADPTQLHQIAMNLITNAYHAVEQSSGRITVELKETFFENQDKSVIAIEPGPYAMLTVSDTGTGIDPTILDKIFEPYFTTKPKDKGTGLGLSVVHGIVKEHGGEIQVHSKPDKGTHFNIFLPLIDKANDTESAETTLIYPGGNERLLLVDDEEPIVQLEKRMLERLGYTVEFRTSSVDALEAFKSHSDAFDMVITDMTMPNMTGDQFAKKLIAIRPNIPVIICTGFSERINKEKAEAMGIKGFLMKPVLLSDLAKTVREALDSYKL